MMEGFQNDSIVRENMHGTIFHNCKQGFTGLRLAFTACRFESKSSYSRQTMQCFESINAMFRVKNAIFRVDCCGCLKEIQVILKIKIFIYYMLYTVDFNNNSTREKRENNQDTHRT